MEKILVAEDEKNIAKLLEEYLKYSGFSVKTVNNGKDALNESKSGEYDIALFDIMMPVLSGTKVLDYLRKLKIDLPVIFITAKDAQLDKIKGLSLGADDYITKPFDLAEVVIRIRTVLKRIKVKPKFGLMNNIYKEPEILKNKDITLNTATHDVKRNNKSIDLTQYEYKILKYLIQNSGSICSKVDISDVLFDTEKNDFSIIEVYISVLRKKLGKPNVIETKRGLGYLIKE